MMGDQVYGCFSPAAAPERRRQGSPQLRRRRISIGAFVKAPLDAHRSDGTSNSEAVLRLGA